eukprot:4499062-Amphidinium_carterae.1
MSCRGKKKLGLYLLAAAAAAAAAGLIRCRSDFPIAPVSTLGIDLSSNSSLTHNITWTKTPPLPGAFAISS